MMHGTHNVKSSSKHYHPRSIKQNRISATHVSVQFGMNQIRSPLYVTWAQQTEMSVPNMSATFQLNTSLKT